MTSFQKLCNSQDVLSQYAHNVVLWWYIKECAVVPTIESLWCEGCEGRQAEDIKYEMLGLTCGNRFKIGWNGASDIEEMGHKRGTRLISCYKAFLCISYFGKWKTMEVWTAGMENFLQHSSEA